MNEIIDRERESWDLTNNTRLPIALGDLPKMPAINPGEKLNSLRYYSKEEIERSSILIYCLRTNKLTLTKVVDGVSTSTSFTNDNDALISVEKDLLDNSYQLSQDAIQILRGTVDIDMKSPSSSVVYTVPSGYFLCLNSLEFVLMDIAGSGTTPTIKFNTDDEDFTNQSNLPNTVVNSRYVFNDTFPILTSGKKIYGTVVTGSTYTKYTGRFFIIGHLSQN